MADIKYVKARGLPWSASAEEVIEFFTSCQVVGGATGVHFISNYDGRPSGTCYLELESQADLDAALARDKDKMGKRYIEVFEATAAELEVDLCRRQGAGGDAGGPPPECSHELPMFVRGYMHMGMCVYARVRRKYIFVLSNRTEFTGTIPPLVCSVCLNELQVCVRMCMRVGVCGYACACARA